MSDLQAWAEQELLETRERTLPTARKLKFLSNELLGHLEDGGEGCLEWGAHLDETHGLINSISTAYGLMAKLQEDALSGAEERS